MIQVLQETDSGVSLCCHRNETQLRQTASTICNVGSPGWSSGVFVRSVRRAAESWQGRRNAAALSGRPTDHK